MSGEDEADPKTGSIAYVAPLVRTLLGWRPGEEPGEIEVEVVAVDCDKDA